MDRRSVYMYILFVPISAIYNEGPKLEILSYQDNKNGTINLTFWLNTSSCKEPSGEYRVEVETRTGHGKSQYDGRVILRNNRCIEIYTREDKVHCRGDRGPAQLFRKVDQSHVEIVWTWFWSEDDSTALRQGNMAVQFNLTDNLGNKMEENICCIPVIAISILITIGIVGVVCWLLRHPRKKSAETQYTNIFILPDEKTKGGSRLFLCIGCGYDDSDTWKHYIENPWAPKKLFSVLERNEKVEELHQQLV